jgi:hypothetical protein
MHFHQVSVAPHVRLLNILVNAFMPTKKKQGGQTSGLQAALKSTLDGSRRAFSEAC